MPGKSPVESKTLLFNVLTALVVMLAVAVEAEAITDPRILPWVTVAIAGINVFLRLITGEPIALRFPGGNER